MLISDSIVLTCIITFSDFDKTGCWWLKTSTQVYSFKKISKIYICPVYPIYMSTYLYEFHQIHQKFGLN